MHQASPADGTSDSLSDTHLVMSELRNDSSEDSLTGGQPEVESTEEEMSVDPSAGEAMAEVGDEPRVIADVLDHMSTLEAESSPENDSAEKVPEPMDAEVQDKRACLEQDTQRPKEEMIEDSGEAQKHAETSSKESDMEVNFVIEDLKQELRRLEEENQLLRSLSHESRHSMHNALQENARKEVEGSTLDSENQEKEDEVLKLVSELETLKAEMQVEHDSHARLESETVALRQEKEGEVSRLSNQIMTLVKQLHELEGEHSSILVKSKDLESNLETIDDEKVKLKHQLASVLEDRQQREEELVGMLESCQEHLRTMVAEHQTLLSTVETSNAAVLQLESQNAALSSEFEEQKQIAESKIADLASELQITQDQQHDLHLQLQGLREENTHIVMKASKLDQEVDELKSDKLGLSSDLERLVEERESREEELEAELRTCREQVQNLEAEKLASVTLVDNLTTQVRELEEDNRQLTGLSNEASQSVQHFWEENTRLIEGYNRLEQEKQAHEGERMELVAGIQTVWEQLHAANEREALLASDLRGLNERRDAEEMLFDQKVKDLELMLEGLEQEKSDLTSKSDEISQVLETLRQETSQALKVLQEEKDQLIHEVSELVKLKEETEQAISVKQISWETQIQGLVSEKAVVMSTVEDLEQQLHVSREEIKDLKEKDEKSNQVILELREEISRLGGEIDKLEEVKERQEGERLELAAELQAAWDQIQAVRDSEANLATELSELKDFRSEEKLKSDELVQELRRQLQELEERTSEAGSKVEQLSKRLNELRKEQELQDENERLAAEIVMLEQEKARMLTEKDVLLGEAQTLKDRVESLELDKHKMAFEIEELNQWLQGPAAEKKQLAANLDEMTQLLKGLELERTQLTTSVGELQEEKERMQIDAGKLQDVINVLEEEKAKSLLVNEDSMRQLESLEEEKQQALRIQEDSALLVQNLNEKIHVLEEKSTRMISVHEDSLLRIQSLEEEKTVIEKLLEEQNVGLNQLHLENTEHVDALGKLEGELELKQVEVQLLKNQVLSLEEESFSMKALHETVFSQLQAMEAAKSQAEDSVVSLGEEKSELLQSLEESELRMQGLTQRSSELSATISRLEEELMKRCEEIQIMSGRLSDLEEEKENSLSQHKELLENLQAENLEHTSKAVSLENKMEGSRAELQRLEEQIESLSTVHQDALLQLQALAEEKVELTKALDALNLSVQKLQAENLEHISKAELSEEVLERRHAEVKGYQDTLFQLRSLDEEKAELVKSLDVSNLSVHELQEKNVEHTDRVKILEDEVALKQAEVQRLKEKTGSLSSAHQESLLQLEVLDQEKVELVNSLDAFNLSIEELQAKNEQHMNTIKTLEDEVAQRQGELQRLHQEIERLSAAHQDSLLQVQTLEEEKADLGKSVDSSNLFVQKLQSENFEHTSKAVSFEEEVERKQAEVQKLEEKIERLSNLYQNSLLQLQALEEEKTELVKSLDVSTSSIQEQHEKIVKLSGRVKFLEEETERLFSAHQDSLLQLEVLKEEKAEMVTSFDAFNLSVQELQVKNEQHTDTIKALEDEVAQRQGEVQRLEEHTERLSVANQNTLLQLQAFEEEKDLLEKALDVANLSAQNLQVENVEHVTLANSLEEEIKRRQADMQDLGKKIECLCTAHQDTLLQLRTLEEEKVELVKCFDASSSSFQEVQEKNVVYSQRVKFLEEAVALKQAEVERLLVGTDSLSTAHDGSLLQLQGLEVEKSTITNQLQECQDLLQKLHTENSELASAARKFQDELYKRRDKIESLDSPVHSLDDKDFREASEYHGVPLQVQSLEGAAETARSVEGCNNLVEHGFDEEMQVQHHFLKADKMKCSKLLEQSELNVKKLELENIELSTTVTKLEKHLHDESQIFSDQIQSLEVERESFGQECIAKLRCLEVEKSQLAKALEESNLVVADLHTVVDYLKASVLDLGRGKDELAKQISLLQEQTCVIVAERDQLSSEMHGVREQLQEYAERLQESENVSKKSKEEALELAKQIEIFREQVRRDFTDGLDLRAERSRIQETMVTENTTQPKQLERCSPMPNGDLVTELEPGLDRHKMSFGQMEITHLIGSNIDPREELQHASLGWVEIITTVCQELAKLLRSVGEEKEKLAQKQGMSHQKTEVLTSLCQELDRLILGVRGKTERFAEELSLLRHKLVKSKNERFSLGSDSDSSVGTYQQLPTEAAPENRELMLDVETSCQTLQSTPVEKTELEAHVANLSSCLADSQGQLKALVIKSSTGNPYLLTSRADDGGHRRGLACFSADENGVLNYGSELKVGRNIKALEQEKKERKGNVTLPSFTQRTQTPGRSFKKCKVSMQQPKRRWIF